MKTQNSQQIPIKYQVLTWVLLILIFLAVTSVVYYLQVKNNSAIFISDILNQKLTNNSDWKKYNNDQYGFQLKYPKGFTLKQLSPENISIVKDGTFDANNEILISVSDNPSGLSAEKWVSKNKQKVVGSKIVNVDLDGVRGVKFTEKGMVDYLSVYLSHNNFIYRFSITKESKLEDTLNQIFSTFIFTPASSINS